MRLNVPSKGCQNIALYIYVIYEQINFSRYLFLPISFMNVQSNRRQFSSLNVIRLILQFHSESIYIMRSIHFTIVVCVLSFSLHTGSCGFIPNFLRQAIHTTVGVIKDIPKRIPTPSEIFEFGKTVLIGLPSELTFNVIHELCKYSHYTHFNFNFALY